MTKYSVMNDETLVEICLLGESGAFEELVLRHENAVMSAARHVTGSRFTAEDASQDAFLSAWMCLDSLRDRSKFKPWVCAIAKNCAMALVTRYRSVVPDISLHLVENEELSDNPDPELSALLSSETDEELHALVDALSEKLRETIRLHYFEGYSVNEIAERLSVPVGTVKWRLAQGRKQLRKGYGIMEKEYDENEALVSRVMRQVEELKLWQLRRDKTGFGEAYENVLAAVESLEESKEKQHMLADVWLRKAWWLEDSEELREKIKEAALAGHNEDVMQAVVSHEHNKLKGEEKIHFMRETQIPELEAAGFREALAYVWFWLGREYLEAKHADEGFDALNRVLDLLGPTDVYYANALSAIWAEKKLLEAEAAGETNAGFDVMGETYRKIGENWYFWDEPGYRGGKIVYEADIAPLWFLSRCDALIEDRAMKPGDKRTTANGKTTLTCRAAENPVVTPAGTFENCLVFTVDSEDEGRFVTVISPGVGIVEQTFFGYRQHIVLVSYKINGGDGLIPFAVGNRWDYHVEVEGYRNEDECYMEVVSASEDKVTMSIGSFHRGDYDENTWAGNVYAARNKYFVYDDPNSGHLVDVEKYLIGAERTARTRREKVHTAVANKVMRNIFVTDDVFNPEYTEKLRWTFFGPYPIRREADRILLEEEDTMYNFQLKDWYWKDKQNWTSCFDQFAVGCNFLYEIVDFALGGLWSNKWIPGYEEERTFKQYDRDVTGRIRAGEDEAVETPVGSFPACRHMIADMQGGLGYWSGHTEFWYAPGVGIVKFLRTVTECGEPWKDAVWLLTAFEGTGDGYFPMEDGFFRKYKAQNLENGYHGSVEYTYLEDEEGLTIYKAAFGTQDRAEYEKVK